jgi:hypothetical protein
MLTSRELATVLAALRHWQQQLAREGRAFADGFPHFVDEEPLSVAEIDTLCDRLNDIDACCDNETA